ncbi:MAG: GntR family transcriptional regulator [Chloroflexota bacterium]
MALTDADRAYHQLKERIITVKMPPGSIIHETELMAELRLGRTPIREALKRLQTENLVVVAPRRGLFVADITITDLQQIFEVRVEIESLCARLATQRFTPEHLAEMRELVAEYRAGDKENIRFVLDLDRRMHSLLARATGNKFLYDEFELFYNLSIRIWHLAINRIESKDIDLEAHLDILAAIEAGDSCRAEQRMREHIQHFHQTIKSFL